jgi:hypothetical protein
VLYVLGAANPGLVGKANTIFKETIYAIIVIGLAWIITNTVLVNLGNNIKYKTPGAWYTFSCTVPAPTPTPVPTTPGGVQPPVNGVTCPDSGVNLCAGTAAVCGGPSCSQYVGAVNQYAGGAASANLLKAIMANESGCNIGSRSPAGAYGLMQLLPATANAFKSGCGVGETIDGNWLTNPTNASKSICIAAKYINFLSSACGSDPRNLAAGYNGGGDGPGACGQSVNCASDQSCSGERVKKWECLYDDNAHTVCNTGFHESRVYAPKVAYCVSHPGF